MTYTVRMVYPEGWVGEPADVEADSLEAAAESQAWRRMPHPLGHEPIGALVRATGLSGAHGRFERSRYVERYPTGWVDDGWAAVAGAR